MARCFIALLPSIFIFLASCSTAQVVPLGDASHRTLTFVSADGAPIAGATATISSWFHSTAALVKMGEMINPRCCRTDDEGTVTTDARGRIAIPDWRFRRDAVTVQLGRKDLPKIELWFNRGRLVTVRIGEKRYERTELDKFLNGQDRGGNSLIIGIPAA